MKRKSFLLSIPLIGFIGKLFSQEQSAPPLWVKDYELVKTKPLFAEWVHLPKIKTGIIVIAGERRSGRTRLLKAIIDHYRTPFAFDMAIQENVQSINKISEQAVVVCTAALRGTVYQELVNKSEFVMLTKFENGVQVVRCESSRSNYFNTFNFIYGGLWENKTKNPQW